MGKFAEIITLFGIVLIHEIGHVFVARAFRWDVSQIELLPFGGVAKMNDWGTIDAWEEIMVAAAGPFVNFSMIAVAVLGKTAGLWEDEWAAFFIESNFWIAAFNLLPIWPLDGGRIMHALASFTLPYQRCLKATYWSGITLAGLFLLWATWRPYPHINAAVIALFLIISNGLSLRRLPYQMLRFLIGKHRCFQKDPSPLPVTFVPVTPSYTVLNALKKVRRGKYHFFCLLKAQRQRPDRREAIKIVSESSLMHACFRQNRPRLPVSEIEENRIQ